MTCFWYPSGDASPLDKVKLYFRVTPVTGGLVYGFVLAAVRAPQGAELLPLGCSS